MPSPLGFFVTQIWCPRFHYNSIQYCVFVTHLEALPIISWHKSDTLISDTDVRGYATLNHRVSAFDNLKNKNITLEFSNKDALLTKLYISQVL